MTPAVTYTNSASAIMDKIIAFCFIASFQHCSPSRIFSGRFAVSCMTMCGAALAAFYSTVSSETSTAFSSTVNQSTKSYGSGTAAITSTNPQRAIPFVEARERKYQESSESLTSKLVFHVFGCILRAGGELNCP